MSRDHLKLQIVVILWGFTAVLGELISLSAASLVLYRTALAALILLIWQGRRVQVPHRDKIAFTLTGFVIGAHWITFFEAVKVANVSICMAGIATLSLWTAILEPLMARERKFRSLDLLFGLIVALGVIVIFQSELRFGKGLLIALASAILAAVFSVINSFHVSKASHHVITCYEMFGAALFTAAYLFIFTPEASLTWTAWDWLWLPVLALFCTVIAFSQYVELLKRMSVFTINFANNLEPIYGILLASLIFQDYRDLNQGFYLGALIIITSICAYPFFRRTSPSS